jgi:DNA polymerase-3 subunit delta
VEDSGFFKTTCDALAEYFPQVNETTCFIFVESEVDKRNRLYKKVKELGYAAEMERQDPSQLASWAGGILAGEGKKITAQTMELLLEKTGDIRMELEKLVSYTLGRDVITASDVEEICTTRITSRVFNMVEAITEGNVRKALDLYEDLLALKEEPRKILPLIGRQFNQIFQVKELMSQGMNRGTIGSALKLKPYIAGKLMNQARAYSPDRLRAAVNLCTDTEEAVKTGQLNDRMAVELLITGKY